MVTILGIAFLVLVLILVFAFILPAVFTIGIVLLLIYLVYRLIKWFSEKTL